MTNQVFLSHESQYFLDVTLNQKSAVQTQMYYVFDLTP